MPVNTWKSYQNTLGSTGTLFKAPIQTPAELGGAVQLTPVWFSS